MKLINKPRLCLSLMLLFALAGCDSSIPSVSSQSISDISSISSISLSSENVSSSVSSISSDSSSNESEISSETLSEISSETVSEVSSEISSEDIYSPIISPGIKNVILFIGDGMGFGHVEAAELYNGAPLNMSSAPLKIDMTTNSLSSGYTDSSASATAMATGTKVYNGSVRMTSSGEVLPNFIDQLDSDGVRSGFITTDVLYGGTPAGFLSHARNRNDYGLIMEHMAESKSDLIIGIAPNNFETLYEDHFLDNGYSSIDKMSELSTTHDRIVSALPTIPAVGTGSSLDELTVFGLDYLDNSNAGFFLGVEGAAIDHRAHDWESEAMILELLAMDKALGVALKWASNRTDTLVIVTADHETGGLSVAPGATEETVLENMNWTTTTHTTASVPFYVWGADETDYSLLNDTVDNTNIYDIIMSTYSSL